MIGIRIGALAAVLAGAALAQGTPPVRAVEAVSAALNVRDAPQGSVVGQAHAGRQLVVQGEQTGSLRVWFQGRSGWIAASEVRPVSSGVALEVATEGLNVRTGPSASYRVIGVVRAGQRYVRAGTSGAWRKIHFGHDTGWVHGGYVREHPIAFAPPPSPGPPAGWQTVHAGLTQQGSQIPRAGLANGTLQAALGVAVEPLGRVASLDGRPFVAGKCSWFGGPRDFVVGSTETGAITGERLRSLNTPLDPTAADLASRPEDFYYVAMRWDYRPNGRTFWRTVRILVVNPRTGKAVVVRPVDWGPHIKAGRTVDLSPQAIRALGLSTDQEAYVAFAAPGTALGPVR